MCIQQAPRNQTQLTEAVTPSPPSELLRGAKKRLQGVGGYTAEAEAGDAGPRGPAGVEETALESLLGGLWGGWAQPLRELLKVTGVSGVRPSGTFPTAFCSPGPCVDSQGTLSQEPHPEGRTPHRKRRLWGQLQSHQRKQEKAGAPGRR